jgi:hypothetical protein
MIASPADQDRDYETMRDTGQIGGPAGVNGLVVPCPFVAGVCNIFYHKHL